LTFKTKFFERLRNVLAPLQRSFRISENTFLIILAVIIGLLGGLGNYAFRKTIEFVHWGIFEQSEHVFGYSMEEWSMSRLAVVLCPVVGGLLVIPLWHWFGTDLKGGFSAFLERVNLRGAKLQLRPIFTRGFGSAITIGTGGSAGQEGPIAMIGGAIGSQFGQLFKMSGDRLKVLVACGAAAGVAATFNAPIAGVFFAQEIILLSAFEMSSFTSIVIASGMATVVSRALLGNHSEITAPFYVVQSYWELILYVMLGLMIGALAALFIETHFRIKDRFAELKMPKLLKPLLGGLLVGVIGFIFPQVFGNGRYQGRGDLDHAWLRVAWWDICPLSLSWCGFRRVLRQCRRQASAAASHCSRRLCLGRHGSLPLCSDSRTDDSDLPALRDYRQLRSHPIMVSCVIGTAVARHFKKDSLETVELSRAGIDLEAGKERNIMKSLRVGDVMVRDVETIPEHMTLGQFARFIEQTHHTNFPLINAQKELTGIISVQDFMGVVFERDLMDLVVVKELATTNVITAHADEDLDQTMRKIGYRNIEQVPVVDRETHRKLVGIISRRDIVAAYNRALMTRTLEEQ
jgi:CIC family chloride channel protein